MEFLSLNNVALSSSGVAAPLNLDSSGNLKVNVEAGGSGGSSSSVTLLAGSATIGSIANSSFGLNSSIPAGSNSIGTVVLGSGSATIGAISNASFSVTSLPALVAGSAIIGKVGIDQSSPGTTNLVQLPSTQTVVLGTGSSTIGSVGISSSANTIQLSSSQLTTLTPLSTVAITAASLPLPTGAALESGGNLATLVSYTPPLGQALASASRPVVLPASQITALTPPTSVAITSLPTFPSGSNTIGSINTVSSLTSLYQLNNNNVQYTTQYAIDRINWANSIRLRIV